MKALLVYLAKWKMRQMDDTVYVNYVIATIYLPFCFDCLVKYVAYFSM